jgi:hypothetical protein
MMDDDKLLQRFPSPDGKRWFELRQQFDGMFYFQEFSETTDAVPVYGAQSYTSPGFRSGLYKSAGRRRLAQNGSLAGWDFKVRRRPAVSAVNVPLRVACVRSQTKAQVFWLPTTNTSPVGQKFVMIRTIPHSRENAQTSAAQWDREAIARGHWSMIRKKPAPV